ncbi:RAMP superfamily CRISPR-associated protein [Actinomyces bouchesdurhonensis]|uniref:RAMP superfamily CRISPR-associated protein n=1 Tax=Actinomyces bouchesdurhonensis TaxID=1852361 RepID=UPI0028ECD67B|nr:RAMP superfamily CRISPR-associated protein [Actinomyces bouchesdurhonensis]
MTFTRYEFTIPVELTSELHIGGVDAVPDRDGEGTVIRFCRNGLDEPTIPGRSIRGAVRAACDVARQTLADAKNPTTQKGEAFSKDNWISLWGDDTDYTGKSANDRGLPSDASLPIRKSALTFHAVSFPQYKDKDSGESPLPRRHGVGIDRTTGAASDGALYEHEFLPRGTRFTIRITAEGRDDEKMRREQSDGIPEPASSESVKKLLEFIVDVLTSGAICLGGRTGSGQGTIQVIEPKLRRTAKTTDAGTPAEPADVLDALIGEDEEGTPIPLELGGWSLEEPARITIDWWSPTGIFVAEDDELTKQRKAAKEAENKEKGINEEVHEVIYPLRDPSEEWENAQLLIPGTSIRGALRSRASRIARTVLAAKNELSTFASHDLHEQIAAEPNLVRYMFGSTEYRGAVTVHDCLSTKRGKRIEVTHNAIDRWTGGVIDGGLFTEAVYLGTKWEPIRIDIDLRQLLNNIEAEKGPEAKREPADADEAGDSSAEREQPKPTHADYAHAAYVLLGLVLAELSAGTLPLGSRSTRGLGQVVVSTIKVEGADRKGVDLPSWNFTGCEALQQPATGAGVMTDTLYKGQRELAEQVLEHLKGKYKKTDWSKRLENGPGAARKQSAGTGAADD